MSISNDLSPRRGSSKAALSFANAEFDAYSPQNTFENLRSDGTLGACIEGDLRNINEFANRDPKLGSIAERLAGELTRVVEKKTSDLSAEQVFRSAYATRLKLITDFCLADRERAFTKYFEELVIARVFSRIRVSSKVCENREVYDRCKEFTLEFSYEALKAFRRENNISEDAYTSARSPLETAEFLTFAHLYGRRKLQLGLVFSLPILETRASRFGMTNKIGGEKATIFNIDDFADYREDEADPIGRAPRRDINRYLDLLSVAHAEQVEDKITWSTLNELLVMYFKEKGHSDLADYHQLRLVDMPVEEIDSVMNLTKAARDYLQQRYKYHSGRFFFCADHWKKAHDVFEIGSDKRFGLSTSELQNFQNLLEPFEEKIIDFLHGRISFDEVKGTTSSSSSWKKVVKVLAGLAEIRRSSLGENNGPAKTSSENNSSRPLSNYNFPGRS